MPKITKLQTGRTAVSIEAKRGALAAASTPGQVLVARMAKLAKQWAKDQGHAFDQHIKRHRTPPT